MERSEAHRIETAAEPRSPRRLSLAAIQAALVSAATGRGEPGPALLRSVRADQRASAGERFAAYRANVRGAHLQALDSAYPVLREVLGPRYWRQLLDAELPVYASPSPDLNAYGDFMPALLRGAQRRRAELRELPYLEALAMLEWQVHRARLAADEPAFDWGAFAKLPDEVQASATLVQSNALALLEPGYPVDCIWRSHQGIDAGENELAEDICCCVHRAGRFDIGVTRLDRQEFEELQLLAAARIGAMYRDGNDALAHRIFAWIQRGWITGFEVAR
jgi:hypothetical protein